jgi:hypothetical protein
VNLRKLILFYFLLFLCTAATAQNTGNSRVKQLSAISDTTQLDTLSLVPGSIKIKIADGRLLDTSYYRINYADGLLILNRKKIASDSIPLEGLSSYYKTFPYLFSSETKHKDVNRIKPDLQGNSNPFSYDIESKNDDIFKMDGLNKSGSISRGITFGNNQDVVVNSNLNLQLSGHLSNNIDILLAATDNNIPIQPEGNTQQLQEFDKVFIQLSNANTKLIAGDFQLTRPKSYFMNFNKKAQGVSFSTTQKINAENKDITKQGLNTASVSAAVSRGKFARNASIGTKFNDRDQESNQGPYHLRGAENEAFIIVLSGTEKVYIDGRLMQRGQENDYIINYNTSEITFTSNQLITKDKRILVEFQYSDKNYARSLVHFGDDFEQNKLKIHLNVYSEQDSKNQPLQQDLTPTQKKLLSEIGDTLSLAVSPSYDSVAFNFDEVLYHQNDTTIGTHTYPKIFRYSTSKVFVYLGVNDSTHYRVTYSNVGQNKGNYNQITSSANGKVFQWVMPDTVTNQPRGSYEPVIQLITPKQKQMVTVGVDYVLSKNSKFSVEGAVSKNDINTFSSANSNDDVGYALKMNLDNVTPLFQKNGKDSSKVKLLTNVNYEYVQKYFSPIERYRSIEFERDWNRGSSALADDQHIVGAAVGLAKKDLGFVGYKFNAFFEGGKYNANRHNADILLAKKGFALNYNGSLLSSASATNTNFYRHKSGISQKIKWVNIGLKDEFEHNKFALAKKDSLLGNSYQFWEWQAFVENSDSTKNHYGINYKERTDFVVDTANEKSLVKSATAKSYGGFLDLIKNQNNQLKLNAAYRILTVDSKRTFIKPDNSLVARAEYNFKLLKGVIYSSTYYEIGSGLEVKKEFSYILVAAGQGVYKWNDYNGNGIKELNEFEVAVFVDEANYIKIFTPTNDYQKVYSNQFNEVLMLKPSVVWAAKTGFRKFVSRFGNQTSYRVDRKSSETDLTKAYNPFLAETADSTLKTLNSSFRNTLFINQMGSGFGLDLSYQDVRNKVLLVNGLDSRQNVYEEARLRWNIIKEVSWNLAYKSGVKKSTSEYFPARDFSIVYYEVEPKFNFQPNTSFRATISFKYTDRKNKVEPGLQRAILQDYGAEVKYNVLQKGSLNVKADFIQIKYNDPNKNTSIAYEMLDALKAGQNITWGVMYQRNLSNNLQLSLTYDGRKSQSSKAIHTGGAQVRAYF